MKTILKSVSIAALLLIPFLIQAQSPIDKVFDKYAGKEGFTTVNISKEMFQMFMSMANDKDTSMQDMKKALGQLTGMKVLTCNADSTNPSEVTTFFNEATSVFPSATYKELMTINDNGDNIRFLKKQDGNGKISEIIMLKKGKHEVVVLSITGSIDMATVSNISKNMNINGMENLKKLKDHQK